METLKEILARHDERCNLLNFCLCIMITLALVTVAFGLVNLEFDVHAAPDSIRAERAPVGAGGDFRLP